MRRGAPRVIFRFGLFSSGSRELRVLNIIARHSRKARKPKPQTVQGSAERLLLAPQKRRDVKPARKCQIWAEQ